MPLYRQFSGSAKPSSQIEYHEFCGTISQRKREQLFLAVSKKDHKLCFVEDEDANPQDNWMLTATDDSRGVSLNRILADGYLERKTELSDLKMKNILFYLLAKGVWQFYDSRLMPQEWTKDSVEFLFEHRNNTVGVFLNQPLISTQHRSQPRPEDGRANSIIHAFPKIRELGIMLLEIHLGKGIDSYRTKYSKWLVDGRPTTATDFRIAKEVFECEVGKNDAVPKAIRQVIGKCLDDRNFRPATQKDKQDTSHVRGIIHEDIVRPLESLLHVMYDDHNDVDALYHGSAVSEHVHQGVHRSMTLQQRSTFGQEGQQLPRPGYVLTLMPEIPIR